MNKLQLLAYFMAMSLLAACSSCPDQYGDDAGTERLYFTLRYERSPNNWQSVIGPFGYIDEDSVKIYDEDGNLVDDFWVANGGGGESSIPIIDSSTPRGEDISKSYFLYLSYEDTDTMRVEFKLKKDECAIILKYGNFFYNNNLISENKNSSFNLGGTIIK